MDITRMAQLSGQLGLNESFEMKEVNPSTDTSTARTANVKAQKNNNKSFSTKSAADVRVQDAKSKIDQDPVATITTTDGDEEPTKIDPKRERINYTISIDKNGAPKVNDVLEVETYDFTKPTAPMWFKAEGYALRSRGQYVTQLTESGALLSSDFQQAGMFGSIEDAKKVLESLDDSTCEIIRAEVYQTTDSIFEHLNAVDSDDVQSVFETGFGIPLPDVEELDQRKSNMQSDIKARTESGDKPRIAVQYKGKMFTGYVVGVGESNLRVEPTPQTVQRYNLSSKEVVLPIKFNSIEWGGSEQDMVVGFAVNDVDPHQGKFDNTPTERPTTGKAQFGTPDPKPGNASDSSTWAMQNNSADVPKGEQLAEHTLAEYFSNRKRTK